MPEVAQLLADRHHSLCLQVLCQQQCSATVGRLHLKVAGLPRCQVETEWVSQAHLPQHESWYLIRR